MPWCRTGFVEGRVHPVTGIPVAGCSPWWLRDDREGAGPDTDRDLAARCLLQLAIRFE
jgi:hypothetical protein